MKTLQTMLLTTTLALSPLVLAGEPQAAVPALDPAQQKQIEQVIHQYIVKNPQVIVEALQTLQQQQMEQTKKTILKTEATSPKYASDLFRKPNDPVAGNANGKVTVVDFFDYQCPHCTQMTPILESLITANPNLRVVFKEFPIRGALSEFAAKAALAANKQGKYLELHKAMMKLSTEQQLTQENILKAAQAVGINVDKLKTDMNAADVNQQVKDNYKLAQNLQLLGTPALFVAKTDTANNAKPTAIIFIPGQVEQAQLKATIDKMGA